MGEVKFYDFNKARKLGSDDEIVDYLRNTATTNINWDFYNNYDNTQIVNRLSEKADKLEIYDTGVNQEELKQNALKSAELLNATNKTTGNKISNYVGDLFGTEAGRKREQKKQEILQNLNFMNVDNLSDEEVNTLNDSLGFNATIEGGKLLSGRESLKARLKKESEKQNILQVEHYKDLTPNQKKYVDDEYFGSVEGFARDYVPLVDSREKAFQTKQQIQRDKEFVGKELPHLLEKLKSQQQGLRTLLKSGEAKREEAQGFLNDFSKIASKFGFDAVVYDNEMNIFLQKDNQYYAINENFFDNPARLVKALDDFEGVVDYNYDAHGNFEATLASGIGIKIVTQIIERE